MESVQEPCEVEKLLQLRITPSTEVKPRSFLFTWWNKPCFPCGELVAITGKAKCGKTFLCSTLMACASNPNVLTFTRNEDRDYKVVWIDTEQSEDSTQEILRDRIAGLSEKDIDDNQYFVYNLRSISWDKRLAIAEHAIVLHSPDLVVIDGIRDVVGDINDYKRAQEVLERLLSLASFTHCCMVCVLHQNKAPEDKTLRGALGTELQNKSFETYECIKDTDSLIFTVQQTASRKYDIMQKLYFRVDEKGLPQRCYLPNDTPNKEGDGQSPKAMRRGGFNPEYTLPNGQINICKLFQYLLPDGKTMLLEQLRQATMKTAGIYSFNFAGKLIQEAVTQQVIFESKNEQGALLYQCEKTIF